jgi:hypothetical protein
MQNVGNATRRRELGVEPSRLTRRLARQLVGKPSLGGIAAHPELARRHDDHVRGVGTRRRGRAGAMSEQRDDGQDHDQADRHASSALLSQPGRSGPSDHGERAQRKPTIESPMSGGFA